ncbi:MAG: DUF4493 domain-containing protein [Muribaculaceae bacterium]|nr:DUF4493 domain-containing protein [Muribaculaceae bacterium]
MKKAIQLGISALAAATLLYGCSDEWGVNGSGATGRIAPMVRIDTETVSSRAADAQSRAEAEDITTADLSLTLSKTDGSYAETWPSIDAFPLDKEFAVGAYNLEVFYGDPKEEGFGLPAFTGSTSLTVVDGQTTELGLTASLANCRFIIKYTDAFMGYMSSWSATVQGAGAAIAYAKDEVRPVYVQPGDVKIVVSVAKPNGVKADFTLPAVKAEARHEYTVTVDVNNGNVGDAMLTVTFDENLAQEDIELNISDAVLSAPVPTAEADGFTSGEAIEVVAGLPTDLSLAMNLIAQAQLGEVLLETSSESLLRQGWPESIDLLKADAATQGTLTTLGLKALGLWNKPDQMAVVDFSGVVKNIKAVAGDNTTRFKLTLKDALMRACEPIELVLSVEGVRLELASDGQFFSPGEAIDLKLGFNGGATAVRESVEFYCFDPDAGKYRPAAIEAVSEPVSRATYDYTVTIATPTFEGDLRVYAVCGDVRSEELTIGMAPFEIAGSDNDVYATHAYLSVIGTEGNPTPDINTASWLVKKATETDYAPAAATVAGNYADLSGLDPDTDYLVKVEIDGTRSKAFELHTEAALQLPNNELEDWTSVAPKSNCVEWTATGWQTLNPITMSQVSDGSNTAYNSTSGTKRTDDKTSGSYAALIRTVGWGSGNTAAGIGGGGLSKVKHVTRGELFLGKWNTTSFNDASVPEYGIEFTSRPSSLSFDYKFSNHKSRMGYAEVAIYDAQGNMLQSDIFEITDQGSYTGKTFTFDWKQGMAKAAKMSVIFRSTATGVSLSRSDIYQGSTSSTAEHVGSKLYVDHIILNY